jgi:integrase/recombinase XerC
MLQNIIPKFLNYCKHYQFSKKALETFSLRLSEYSRFLEPLKLSSLDDITYVHLSDFVTSGDPSVHVKKARVWTLHQFFHYLEFHKLIGINIAQHLPYPRIEKNDPQFLSLDELKSVLTWFLVKSTSLSGLRNLIIVMMLVFLGLRLSALRNLNIQDLSLPESLIWVREKGYVRRPLPIPQILCIYLYQYLKKLDIQIGPLFLSKRKKRISTRSVQYIFDVAEKNLRPGKHLHCHLLRHTAATQINQSSGVDITQAVLGHRSRRTTEAYVHLDGDLYAKYMASHPYHQAGGGEPCMI